MNNETNGHAYRTVLPDNYGDIIIRDGRICVSGRREYGLRVDEIILKCVAFVGEMLGPDRPGDLHGTGFFVSVPPESPELGELGFAYFVTAKHVAKDLEHRVLYMRVNKVGGGVTDFENTIGNQWYLHPTDLTADVAVTPVAVQTNAEVKSIGIEEFGTPERLAKLQIGIGDEVFSAHISDLNLRN